MNKKEFIFTEAEQNIRTILDRVEELLNNSVSEPALANFNVYYYGTNLRVHCKTQSIPELLDQFNFCFLEVYVGNIGGCDDEMLVVETDGIDYSDDGTLYYIELYQPECFDRIIELLTYLMHGRLSLE